MINNHNTFVSLLSILNIKHTKYYSNKFYNEHPYKNNMYGYSCMLSEYGIENKGFRFKNKDNALKELEVPFITKLNNDFVVVCNIKIFDVEYIWQNKKQRITVNDFISKWDGIVLLIDPNEYSIEPNYRDNLKNVVLRHIKYFSLFFACFLIIAIIGLKMKFYNDLILIFSLLINFAGAYISLLLVLKQLHIQNNQSDKICSLFIGKNDCNNILESEAAKFGGFSWSEIGLGYFIGNILMITLFPYLYIYTILINVCALPFSLWSYLVSKISSKAVVSFVLIVQGLLWLLFIYNLLMEAFNKPYFNIYDIMLTSCIYIIPIFFLNIFNSILSDANIKEKISQELNSLKANENLFNILVKERPKYKIDKTTSSILLGNPASENLISIISNAYCNPCAQLHNRINHILKTKSNDFCIQYIFSSFNEKLEDINKFIFNMYNRMGQQDFLMLLDEWFKEGKYHKDIFFDKYQYNETGTSEQVELDKHKKWLVKARIFTTPTILLNGYELPQEIYKIDGIFLLSKIKLT